MKKAISRLNGDRLLAISAIFISLMTLFIFLYQTSLLEEQSRLSVRPRLTFSKNINKSSTINNIDSTQTTLINLGLTVRNNGLGPAIIHANKVLHQQKSYNIISFFDTVYPKLSDYGVFTQITELKVGEAITASETVILFNYQFNLENEQDIYNYLGIENYLELPFHIWIEYASLYEEKWVVESENEGHPEKVD